jgi:hypothetical protein
MGLIMSVVPVQCRCAVIHIFQLQMSQPGKLAERAKAHRPQTIIIIANGEVLQGGGKLGQANNFIAITR